MVGRSPRCYCNLAYPPWLLSGWDVGVCGLYKCEKNSSVLNNKSYPDERIIQLDSGPVWAYDPGVFWEAPLFLANLFLSRSCVRSFINSAAKGEATTKLRTSMSMTVACLFAVLSVTVQTSAQITTFNAPGAGTGSGQGTFGVGIVQSGEIAGYYIDANNVYHGFLRSPCGTFTTFDSPGAGTAAGEGTTVLGLNLEGATVGYYLNAKTYYAFLRTPDGKFTTFAAPGACNMSVSEGCHGTGAWNINLFGTIVGPYEDTSGNFVAHTFVRSPDGRFTSFEVPGSSMEAGQGTLPASFSGLNDFGAITGLYYDANNVFHGFLRNPNGTFIKFEAPGADTTDPFYGTFPASLSDLGAITGDYLDASGVYHGFLRVPEGSFTSFEAPGADTTPGDFNGTFPANINLLGAITGDYLDASEVSHGFLRSPDGTFTTFDAPGAGTSAFQGTVPTANNLLGATTGYYIDASNVYHGFLGIPCGHWCEDNDKGTTAPTVRSPTIANQLDPNFPTTLSPILHPFGGRLMPWYRWVGAQPSK